MNRLFKTAILLICAAALGSCADLDIQSDGRVGYEDIFGHYERTVNYYNRCIGYVPQIGFLYSNTPLASFCDEAHDASDYADGPVSRWYRGYTSTTYNPLSCAWEGDCWTYYYQAIRHCNTFLSYIEDPEYATYQFRDDEKQGWIAQVRVARAFYYLQLIKRYGGGPLVS